MTEDYYFTDYYFGLQILMFYLFRCTRCHFYSGYLLQLLNLIEYYYKIIGIRSSIITNYFVLLK
jgi:hypothetical protein